MLAPLEWLDPGMSKEYCVWRGTERGKLGENHPKWNQTRLLSIVGAKRWFDSENDHTLDLTCCAKLGEEARTKEIIRWLHVE